jgi:hypothetical protein
MADDIEAFFARAALIQAIIHADKEPPEAAFDNIDDLIAWLNDEQKRTTDDVSSTQVASDHLGCEK